MPQNFIAGGRSFQGYNAQVVASPEQVIVAADVTQQSNDSGQLAARLLNIGRTGPIRSV